MEIGRSLEAQSTLDANLNSIHLMLLAPIRNSRFHLLALRRVQCGLGLKVHSHQARIADSG